MEKKKVTKTVSKKWSPRILQACEKCLAAYESALTDPSRLSQWFFYGNPDKCFLCRSMMYGQRRHPKCSSCPLGLLTEEGCANDSYIDLLTQIEFARKSKMVSFGEKSALARAYKNRLDDIVKTFKKVGIVCTKTAGGYTCKNKDA